MLPITKTHWLHFLMFILQKRAFLSNHKTLKFSFTIITTEPILGHLCLIKCNGGDHVYTMFFALLHKRWRNQGCFALYGTNHKHHFISVRFYLQLFVGVRMSCLCCLCLFAYVDVQHILRFPSSFVPYVAGFSGLSLFWLSLRYSLTFMHTFIPVYDTRSWFYWYQLHNRTHHKVRCNQVWLNAFVLEQYHIFVLEQWEQRLLRNNIFRQYGETETYLRSK